MARNVNMDDVGIYQVSKNANLHGAPSRFQVTLTESEIRIATWVGKQRRAVARENNRDLGTGPSSTIGTAENDIRGALAEYAASIAFNLHWRPAINRIYDRDIGDIIDVRSTVLPHGRLIIKIPDIKAAPNVPFVLVDCHKMDQGIFTMLGWRYAKDAKEVGKIEITNGDKIYYIAQNKLHSNESLVDWVSVRRVFD